MIRRSMARVLIALAVPALAVPALAPPAHAAAKVPDVPSVAKVAKTYPHLAGGTAYTSTVTKVRGASRNCKPGKVIRGARGQFASYAAAGSDHTSTAARPSIGVSALRFRNARSAIGYLHASARSATKCPGTSPDGTQVKVKVTRIRFRMGDERWGYTSKVTLGGTTYVARSTLVRAGRTIVMVNASTTDGSKPAVSKVLKLTKVTLRTAR